MCWAVFQESFLCVWIFSSPEIKADVWIFSSLECVGQSFRKAVYVYGFLAHWNVLDSLSGKLFMCMDF